MAADVTLAWDRNAEATVTGYKVYYGTASKSYGPAINAGNNINYTLTGLNSGTYYFAVTAYDSSGSESGYSNEVVTSVGTPCTYSISPLSQAYGVTGGTGSVAVTSGSGCAWSAVSNVGWITVTAGASGSGNGSVAYGVASNATTSSRIGTITIGGQIFTVTQSALSCGYSISPTSQSAASTAGSGNVSVSTTSSCGWTTLSNASWITITSGANGTGNGSVGYSIATNTTTSSRTGTLTVAGQTFTVTQAGVSCSISISPTSKSFTESAGTGSVSVTAASGCTWTATSNASWITITSGTSGSGNGTVNYSVPTNTSINSRTGTVTVAGQTFTVTQAGVGCTFSISPTSQSLTEGAGTGSISVTALAGCAWTATSNAGWITITSGGSGSGNGTVSYSVSANTSTSSRTGTMTVAGQTFTVSQAGASCTYVVSPTSASIGPDTWNGGASITTSGGCNWTASSNASWISIASAGSGTGSGLISYSCLANSSTTSRTGTLTIAGKTLTVTQAAANCTFTITPASQSTGSNGGPVSFSVSSPTGCNWTAASNSDWISLASGSSASRTGSGAVDFSVTPNKSKNSRAGTVLVAGQTLTVTQDGTACSVTLSPTGQYFSDAGGSGTVSVSSSGCSWIASSNSTWITIISGANGTGNGTVTYSFLTNVNTNSRTGTLTVGGKTFTVTQAGAGCGFTISPASQAFGGAGGSGSVQVQGPGGCDWTAISYASWITISSGSSGTGSSTVNYSVAANRTNKSRTGTLNIAGQTLTVSETGKNQVYFSQIANGEDWVSSIVLTNPSATESATGSITLMNDQGEQIVASFNDQPASEAVSFSIRPLGSVTLTTDGRGSLVSGSALVNGNIPLSGVVKYSHPTLGVTGVGDSAPLRTLMTPVVRNSETGMNTGIAINNSWSSDVGLILSLRGLDGREVEGGLAEDVLPAGGHMAKFIDQLFPRADTSNFEGTLTVSTTGQEESLVATAIQIGSSPGEFTTLPVVPVDPLPMTTELYFAQFANGEDWKTSLFLTNPTDSGTNGELTFFDDKGLRLTMSVNGNASTAISASMQPQGGIVIPTDGAGELVSGSARVVADNAIGGVLRFAHPALGMAGVGASEPMEGFIAPITRSADENWSTGIAIASVGSPITVKLTLRGENGEPVPGGQTVMELSANGHVSRFVEQLFPEADTREFRGTLTVAVEGGKVVGTALQLGSRAGQFTALPVTEIR